MPATATKSVGKHSFSFTLSEKLLDQKIKKQIQHFLLDCLLGIKVLAETILTIFESGMPADLIKILPPDNFYDPNPIPIAAFKPKVRVLALDIDKTPSIESSAEDSYKTNIYNTTYRKETKTSTPPYKLSFKLASPLPCNC